MAGLVRIDDAVFRFLGPADQADGVMPPPMRQTQVTVFATRTLLTFEEAGVQLQMTFTTPAVLGSWSDEQYFDLVSRGITYIRFLLQSVDGRPHAVNIYFDQTAEIVVNDVSAAVSWRRQLLRPVATDAEISIMDLVIGADKQSVLSESGDFLCISWGYLHVASSQASRSAMAGALESRSAFIKNGSLPQDDLRMPRAYSDDWPVLALVFADLPVAAQRGSLTSRFLMVGIDDHMSVNYFGRYLPAFWKAKYGSFETLLAVAHADYVSGAISSLAERFDLQLVADARAKSTSRRFSELVSLAYRQTVGATKLTTDLGEAASDARPVHRFFMKEISSDGDIQTVDVIYPASPLFLYLNPKLLALQLLPILEYALNMTSDRYPFVWAPHLLGFYPIASIHPSQQENMPIEESANLLILLAAVARRLGNSTAFVDELLPDQSWQQMGRWADYLVSTALLPGNQLYTDDFEGPSKDNANLAAKGILGIASYAAMLEMNAQPAAAQSYWAVAKNCSLQWRGFAMDPSRAHYKLECDKSGTYSAKYNFVWGRLMGFDLFSDVINLKTGFFSANLLTPFGVPLDSRSDYAKYDWNSWF